MIKVARYLKTHEKWLGLIPGLLVIIGLSLSYIFGNTTKINFAALLGLAFLIIGIVGWFFCIIVIIIYDDRIGQ